MKRCLYCGAEYPDDVSECPIDHEAVVDPAASTSQQAKVQSEGSYEILPLRATAHSDEWVPILMPRDSFEGNIIVGRLTASGIPARLFRAVLGGGWTATISESHVQVHARDYSAARELLCAA